MSLHWWERKRSLLKTGTIVVPAVVLLLLAACGSEDTAVTSPTLLVTGNVSTDSDGVTELPPGAGQTLRAVPPRRTDCS